MKPSKLLAASMVIGAIAALAHVMVVAPASPGAGQEAQAAQTASPNVYHVYVDGMACPLCAFSIKRRLEAIEGVQSVGVNMAESLFSVTVGPETALDREQVRGLVQDAGFSFRAMERARTPAD